MRSRYSAPFCAALALLLLASLFSFVLSASRRITVADCERLGIPVLLVDTSSLGGIKRKDKYERATVRYTGSDSAWSAKIRGHGNSTWRTPLTQKRPYLLKFDEPTPLVEGLPAARKWILLANAFDRSMLRNYYAEHLSHNVWNRMRWNPRSAFVTLFLDGKYMGLYGVTEKADIAPGRIEFSGDGFLAEVDSHEGRPYSFFGIDMLSFHIREPKTTDEDYERYAEKILELEHIIYDRDFNDEDGFSKHFDEASFIDWYLLEEFQKNYDAKFYNSVFMTYDYDTERLSMGPVWDSDLGFGNTSRSDFLIYSFYGELLSDDEWSEIFPALESQKRVDKVHSPEGFLINQQFWFNRLFADKRFVRSVRARYAQTREALAESIKWIREQGELLNEAAGLNDSVWGFIGSSIYPRAPGYLKRKTYMSEVEYLADWCERRMAWLDGVFLDGDSYD